MINQILSSGTRNEEEQSMLTTTEERLLAEAGHVLPTLESPDWENCNSIFGDWEFCIPESVSDRWGELSLEAKLVAYLVGTRGVQLFPEQPDI